LHKTLRTLATENISEVCIVPISFVSDHVETLGEIDHEARKEAATLGITRFEMTPGLNNSPTFISALMDLVETAIGVNLNERERGELVAAD
jgi:ferrochelatase